jgi:uncharacterized protein
VSTTDATPTDTGARQPTRVEPPVTETTAPFWEATRDQRLLVQWCDPCDQPIFYPREVCPTCLGTDLSWRASAGSATVHALSVQHRAGNPFLADRVPYVVALVDLDEGIRMMTNVVDCDPESVHIGQRVRVAWEPMSDGRNLPVFAPDGGSGEEEGR